MPEQILSGFSAFFNWGSFLYMNLGLFLGIVFGSVLGLTVMLCLVLFLPITYSLDAIHSFMFLLGIYCAGSYGGSISAILIKTPSTPHAAATMMDGHPLALRGQAQKALNVSLYASFAGGIISALVLLFLAPEVAKVAMKMGSPEYFLICAFGLTIIAGVSGESLLKGIISGCVGLFLSFIGMDLMSGDTMRFTFDNINLYSIGSLAGILVGIIPGTGASIASFLSYDFTRKVSKKPKEFGHRSIEGIAAAECANNAITGTTLIPLLTLGIPGDVAVALMLGALRINGLTPGPNLFTTHSTAVYAIMIGLIFVNIFMLIQGKYLVKLFAKVVRIPQQILIPSIAIFCFAGAYSLKESMFDVGTAIGFGVISYIMDKLGFSAVPTLLGLVLGALTEKNLRRSLMISDGEWSIFLERPFSLAFCVLILLTIVSILYTNYKKIR